MDFSELVRRRESCRSYTDRPVPREKLVACVEAARMAPSACNSQPWHFVIVDEPEQQKALAEATDNFIPGMNAFAAQAPASIIVLEGKATLMARLGGSINHQYYAHMDVGNALAYLTLAAADQGLATCILGVFNEKQLKAAFAIPESFRIRAVVLCGYTKREEPRAKRRKALDEILSVNSFNRKNEKESGNE